jgi:hypothetical protein
MNRDFQFTWRKTIAGKMSFYHNIALSFYRNIAHQNRSFDEGLRENFWPKKYRSFNLSFPILLLITILTITHTRKSTKAIKSVDSPSLM